MNVQEYRVSQQTLSREVRSTAPSFTASDGLCGFRGCEALNFSERRNAPRAHRSNLELQHLWNHSYLHSSSSLVISLRWFNRRSRCLSLARCSDRCSVEPSRRLLNRSVNTRLCAACHSCSGRTTANSLSPVFQGRGPWCCRRYRTASVVADEA